MDASASIVDGSNNNPSKEKAMRKILHLPGIRQYLAIDHGDFCVVREALSSMGIPACLLGSWIREIVRIDEFDEERRVTEIKLLGNGCNLPPSLPDSLGQLSKLKRLSVATTSLPESIGRLKNLESLTLRKIRELPQELGNLRNLQELHVSSRAFSCLPSSIGRLRKLQHLFLVRATNLSSLPEEIGELTALKSLNLSDSKISSLPSSIGRLKNLKYLVLPFSRELLQLPEELGNLTSLERLNLNWSSIESLPSSMGRLQNLRDLDLLSTENLFQELGVLYLNEFFLMLARSCRSLTTIIWDRERDKEPKLVYALACNEARPSIPSGNASTVVLGGYQYQWPDLLVNATSLFTVGLNNDDYNPFVIRKPDAIYRLLMDGRESFLCLLINRNTNQRRISSPV